MPASVGLAPGSSAIEPRQPDSSTLSFDPYEGDEAPFFVCYARDDRERIYPVLEALHGAGLPIWFDRGIAPGAVWTDVLAESIERARTVIFFLTARAASSRFCRAELEFAFQHGVPVVVVELEAAKLPSGLELQIGSLQHIDAKQAGAERIASEIARAAEGIAAQADPIRAPRRWSLAIAASVCFLAVATLAALLRIGSPEGEIASLVGGRTAADASSSPAAEGGILSEDSVAVLAFEARGLMDSEAHLGVGLAEEIAATIAKVPSLRVASPRLTSALDLPPAQLARAVDARYVLAGSIYREGDRTRVLAELLDGETGRTRWSETLDLSEQDVIRVQIEIAERVAEEVVPLLASTARPQLESGRLRDPAAHLAYLQGLGELRSARSGPELESAIATLESAIAIDPGHAAAFAALCRAHLATYARSSASSALALAEGACAAANDRAPEDYAVLLARAELLRTAGDRDAALATLARAATFHPADARIERERAMALEMPDERQGALERSRALAAAEAAFERAIDLEPGYWGHRADYGRFLFRSGRDVEALEVFREIAEAQPDSAEAQADYGALLMNAGENEAARSVFEGAVELDPPNAQALTNLGLLYSFSGEYARAAAMQQRAVEVEGEDHRYWGRLAEALFMLDEGERARAAWEFALELVERGLEERPDDATALGMRAYYLAALHAEERTDAAISEALALRGDDRETLYYLAVASCVLERNAACAHFARRSVEQGMPIQYIEDEPALAVVLEEVRAPVPVN